MKKTVLIMAMAFGLSSAFAQDLTSKKGEPILPEAGDWAISWDATPFLQYAGNFLNGATSTNSAPTSNWVNSSFQTITGKMFKDEKTAYRASVRLGFGGVTNRGMINDATVTTAPTYPNQIAQKEDKLKISNHNIGIGAGMEMRRGKTRLQGYYGGELWIWMSGSKDTYTYGNSLAATGTVVQANAATTTGFGSNASLVANGLASNLTTDTYGNGARVLTAKAGSTFGVGIRGFIGAEYFIFSKISIGAEYGWGLGLSTTGASTFTMESVNLAPAATGSQTKTTSKGSAWKVDTDINGGGSGTGTGSLKLTLHF